MCHYTLELKVWHEKCHCRLEILWMGVFRAAQIPKSFLACSKFIKLNIPNVKATGDSSMVDSEVNIKITGPN